MNNEEAPAFPQQMRPRHAVAYVPAEQVDFGCDGLKKIELFAAFSMMGQRANPKSVDPCGRLPSGEEIAERAVLDANALCNALREVDSNE